MREFKFRSWNKYKDNTDTEYFIMNYFSLETLISGDETSYTTEEENVPAFSACSSCISTIGGGLIMQYTGLKDCHGKEIYEGDIVSMGEKPNRYRIGWGEGNDCSFCIIPIYGDCIGTVNLGYGSNKFMLIIGNIYENPELLKERDGRK